MMSLSPQYRCPQKLHNDMHHANGIELIMKPAPGGCGKRGAPPSCSSPPESCSEISSFDSEVRHNVHLGVVVVALPILVKTPSHRFVQNESSFLWQRSCTIKADEDVCCAVSGSPVGMLHCKDALDEDDNEDEDATQEWAPGKPALSIAAPAYHHVDAEETLRWA